MRNSYAIKLVTILLTGSIFLSSCKRDHEIHKKPFEVKTKTWYRVSPATPAPIIVNGVTYTSFTHFPGGGTGQASHMGNCKTYFNQLAYTAVPEALPQAPPAGSVGAALTEVPGYPVIGAPLPLIQAGDFNDLSLAISSLHIPESVYNKIVNQVFYNNKGDAIFISAITGAGGTFPISEIKVGFNGKALITGGRGKFRHAVGEMDYSGYFNIADANDAEYNAKGWIAY